MRRPSGTQPYYQKGPIPPTTDRGSLGQATNGKILHQTGHHGRIPQCLNKGRRRMENDIYHKIRHLRILGYALWANQRTRSIPKMDQPNLAIRYRYMLHSVPGRCPIYSDNLEQHHKDVAAIIRSIRQQGMKLKPLKCEFHQRETEYLGFIINNEGVKVDPIKTAAIWDWKAPTNKKGIQ